jgi:NAD(P)-dependent dehydrogenase (short-subunit alcohol dehydrogenase family)
MSGTKSSRRVAIVTGGANGMGRAIGLRLAREAVAVVVCDVDDKNALKTAADIEAVGSEALAAHSDVSKSADVKKVVGETLKRFGRVDILVNNVGIGYPSGSISDPSHILIENLTEDEWDKVMNINLKSMFLFSKEVAPIMKRQRSGKIVSISSIAALTGGGSSGGSGPAYAVSKAGIVNLTKTLARQLGPYNVNVNCIAPGSVPETAFKMTEQEIEEEKARVPLRRLGRAIDIAEVVAFLCSEGSQWITGQTINVNGGLVT